MNRGVCQKHVFIIQSNQTHSVDNILQLLLLDDFSQVFARILAPDIIRVFHFLEAHRHSLMLSRPLLLRTHLIKTLGDLCSERFAYRSIELEKSRKIRNRIE